MSASRFQVILNIVRFLESSISNCFVLVKQIIDDLCCNMIPIISQIMMNDLSNVCSVKKDVKIVE